MRYNQLLEYNEDKIFRELNSKFEKKQDHSLEHENIIDLARDVKSKDPGRGKYTFWILNRYVNDGIKFYEDIVSKAIPAIEKHLKLSRQRKLKPEHQDINRFKNLDALMDAMDEYESDISKREKAKGFEKELIDNDEVEILHNDSEYKLVTPKTERASCYYGTNTRWCTAGKTGKSFRFFNSSGPLYILLHKPSNQRWQFHFQTDQFMDDNDRIIDRQKFIKEHPRVMDIMSPIAEKNKSVAFNKNPSEESKLVASVRKNPDTIQHIKNPSEPVQLAAITRKPFTIEYIKNPTQRVQLTAVKQELRAIEFIENPSERVQLAAVKENGFAIQYIENPSLAVQLAAVEERRLAIQFIENPSERVQLAAVKQNGYIIQFIENPSENVQLAAVKQNSEAIKYIKNPSEAVQFTVNPNKFKSKIKKFSDEEYLNLMPRKIKTLDLYRSGKPKEFYKEILNNAPNEFMLSYMLNDNDLDMDIRKTALKKLINIYDSQIQKIIKNPNETTINIIRQAIDEYAENDRIKPEHKTLLNALAGYAHEFDKEWFLKKLEKNHQILSKIKNPTDEMYYRAGINAYQILPRTPEHIKDAIIEKNPRVVAAPTMFSDEQITRAIEVEPTVVDRLLLAGKYQLSKKQRMIALKKDPSVIGLLPNQTEEEQLFVFKQNPKLIAKMKNVSPAIQLAAVKQDPELYKLIKKPSKIVKNYMNSLE